MKGGEELMGGEVVVVDNVGHFENIVCSSIGFLRFQKFVGYFLK